MRASAQSANFGSRPRRSGERGALFECALEALLADRDVEAGLAERARERPEGVPVERLRRQPALVLVDVARGRRPAELLPQLAQQAEQLLPRGEPPRHEARRPLGGVPRAEVLDDRLRMDGRLRVRRELAHRRRAAEALGARAELGEDLLVGIALADSRLELRERARVDLGHRPEARLLGHGKNGRAGWENRKSARAGAAEWAP